MTDLDPPTPALLTIGAFAAASRLSPKALRLYDDLDLLPPARVDEQSGYRHYSPDQLERARLIGWLRQLDWSLADIRAVLDAPPGQRAAQMRRRLAQAEREHLRRRELARYIIRKLEGDPTMTQSHTVESRFVPEQPVVTVTRRVLVPELSGAIGQDLRELRALLSAQGAQPAGAPFVIYHGEVGADSDGPIEVCVPYAGAVRPEGEAAVRLEPAHFEAFVTLRRREFEYPALLSAYDATEAYARAEGGSPLHCREVYPYDWDAAGPDDPAGEIAWPYVPRG